MTPTISWKQSVREGWRKGRRDAHGSKVLSQWGQKKGPKIS